MSDILSKLQSQSQDFQNIASRGQALINDFDTDKLITQGTDYAYRMGKEQLGALVGSEAVAAIHQGSPLVYKTGKTVWNAYNRPDETAQAFKDKISGKISQKLGEAGRKARAVVNENQSGGSNPYLDESRNFKYNPNEGTITTEGGEPVEFGAERTPFRTPLEQQQFDSPALPRRPVGRVPDRQDFSDEQSSFRTQPVRESELQARFTAEREALPTFDEGGGAPAPSIGEARVPGEFIAPEGQVGTSYTRPGTQLRVQPDAQGPNINTRPEPATEAETEPLAKTEDLRANLRTTGETNESSDTRLANINEKYGRILREQQLKDPIGSAEGLTRRAEPSALDLEDIPQVRIATQPTALGTSVEATDPFAAFPSVPTTTAPQTLEDRFRLLQQTEPEPAEPEPFITRPTALPDGMPSKITGLSGGDKSGGLPTIPEEPEAEDAANQASKDFPTEETTRASTKPDVPQPDDDEFGLSRLTSGIGEGGEGAIGATEAIADAIPGVGEIIGGIIGIGAAIAGAVEASKVQKPPTQPAGMPMMQTAFDSAPVIDSSDYHQL